MNERPLSRHTASLESLNSLPDRFKFMARLGVALAVDSPVAVLFFDIDGLKDVNDSFGHALGDQLLVAVCQRLKSVLPPDALLARFAGDEFLLFDPSARNSREAVQLTERMLDRLSQAFTVDGYDLNVRASVGAVVSSPSLSRPEDLLRAANMALHEAKLRNRGLFCVFDAAMWKRANDRLVMTSELRRALDRGEFKAYYQPQVDLSTGVIVGVEALVRWQHPRRGLISPGEFIPLAEETGLIIPIGGWVMEEACRQLAEWRASIPAGRRLALAVNLSARQLRQSELVDEVLATAARHAIPLNRLELELTERPVAEGAARQTDSLQMLRRRKAKLVIDDFGMGLSSLSHLQHWPVDIIKIDRSFIIDIEQDIRSLQLFEGMIDVGRALGAEMTAEGVETPGQVGLLRALRVERAQGFNFSPPLPAIEISALLESDHRFELPPPTQLTRASRRHHRRAPTTGPLS